MLRYLNYALAAMVGSLLLLSQSVAQDDEAELAFGQCRGCHQVGPGARNQFGPILNGVMERSAGRVERYDYSEAFTKKAAFLMKANENS